jgi:DNA invertase Pin-like site-specific DNA recombinase
MLIRYARVSTLDQNLDLQEKAIQKSGCNKIFVDKVSGSRFVRAGLEKSLEQLREGDTFIVWKLDRLGRNINDLIDFVKDLESKKIEFKSLTDNIDISTSSGRFLLSYNGCTSSNGTRTHYRANYSCIISCKGTW